MNEQPELLEIVEPNFTVFLYRVEELVKQGFSIDDSFPPSNFMINRIFMKREVKKPIGRPRKDANE